jgi:hypothetical protein
MESWVKILKTLLPALWLSWFLLFPLDSTGREVSNSCCASPYSAEDSSPTSSECGCGQLQGVPNAWRREGKESLRPVAATPDANLVRVVYRNIPSESQPAGEAMLFSQRWQFVLRAAVPPRAPTPASSAAA